MSPSPRRLAAVAATMALIAVACGSSGNDDSAAPTTKGSSAQASSREILVQLASYDLSVGRDLRLIVGLQTKNVAGLVSFGSVELRFAYLGESTKQLTPKATLGPPVTANFLPIAGQKVPAGASGPRVVEPSEGVGVYAAEGVRFDKPGVWGVSVKAVIDGKPTEAKGNFNVQPEPSVPVPGEPAPRSENDLPGAEGVPPKAVDSRAAADGTVPDPELHATTVAAAIGSGRPTMVVVSTPVYCQSRFCGPVTDSVHQLAKATGEGMSFIHLEVWRDFEAKKINKAAADWIYPKRTGEPTEPWVFLVGRDGKVLKRWDNVASDGELAAAVQEVLAPA